MAQRHRLVVVAGGRDVQSLLEFICCTVVLTQQSRADACVINGNEFIIVIGLLCMLAMVHVTQIKLFPLEKDDSKAIESQCTANIIVEHSGTQVEPFVILACLS